MKIGFIGLGTVGRSMASRLQGAGHVLVVTDLVRQAASVHLENGATWAATPRAVAEACDVVFTSLPTPADVETVGTGEQGLAAGFRKGAAWIDLSTNAVDVVRRLHTRLAEKGVHFLDAPVAGGPSGAASGKLAIWVGGDKAVFDRYKPPLDAMGDHVRHIGAIGTGTITKLVHSCGTAAISAALAEVFTMGVKAGVDPLTLWEALREGSTGRQRTFEMMGKRFLPGISEPPNFQLKLLQKDVMLAVQLGREISVPMRLCSLTLQELTEAMNRGWGDRDSMAYMLLQQERAGIPPIAVPQEQIKAVVDRG